MKIINGYRNFNDKGAVIAFGNFDGIHKGHDLIISSVKKISKEMGLPSLILTFEPHPEVMISDRKDFLLLDDSQKVELISRYGIDYLAVVKFDENFSRLKPDEFIKIVLVEGYGVKHIVAGCNCSFGYKSSGNIKSLHQYANLYGYGVTDISLFLVDNSIYSSSLLRELLKNGNITRANEVLGRPYQINGKVIKGLNRGKALGFPTINVNIDHIITPKFGVYYSKLTVDRIKEPLYGVVNIGMRPTFGDLHSHILEMHILGFEGDLYDCKVCIQLLGFLRPEQRFENVERLKEQIRKDVIEAENLRVLL